MNTNSSNTNASESSKVSDDGDNNMFDEEQGNSEHVELLPSSSSHKEPLSPGGKAKRRP